MVNKAVIGVAAGGVLLYLWARSRQQGEEDDAGFGGGGGFGGAGEYAGNPYDTDGDGIPNESDPTPNGPSGGQNGGGLDTDGDGVQDSYDPFPYDPERGPELYDTTTTEGGDVPTGGTDGYGDADGDGIPDFNDYYYGPGAEGPAGKTPFLDTGAGFIVGTTVAGATISGLGAAGRAAYTKLRAPKIGGKGLIEFAPETATTRSLQSAIDIRKAAGPAQKFTVLEDVARISPEATSIAARTETAGVRLLKTVSTSKAAAVVSTEAKLSAATARAASAASQGSRVLSIAHAAAPAARVAGRVAGAADIAFGVYTAGRNLGETAAASQALFDKNLTEQERQRALQLSGRSVARGTEFLSLGAASIDPRGDVRVFNQSFNVDAPNSLGEAGRNIKRNLGTVSKNLKSGGKDKNRWTFWK